MASHPFACAYHEETGTLIVSGDVDERGATELRQQLRLLTADHTRSLVMDLSSVRSLPNAAVGVIAAARADMRAHFNRLDLVAAPGSVACAVLPRFGMSVRECEAPKGKPLPAPPQPA